MTERECDLTSQDTIWEEPEHRLNPNDMFGENKSFRTFTREYKTLCGMRLRDGDLVGAGKMLLEGNSVTQTSKRTNMCRNTVAKLAKIINTKKELYCQCGKPLKHSGVCLFRKKNTTPTAMTFGSISLKPAVHILGCGCIVGNVLNARIIKCDSEYCFV